MANWLQERKDMKGRLRLREAAHVMTVRKPKEKGGARQGNLLFQVIPVTLLLIRAHSRMYIQSVNSPVNKIMCKHSAHIVYHLSKALPPRA